MAEGAELPPEQPEEAVTVSVTYSGSDAEVLRTLALLEGRTPEEVALDRIARGISLTLAAPIGEDAKAMAILEEAMFDGPPDLSERADEGLFGVDDR